MGVSEPPSIHLGGPMGVSEPPSSHLGGPMSVREPPNYPPRGAHGCERAPPVPTPGGPPLSISEADRKPQLWLGGGSEDLGVMLLCDGQLQG